MGLDAGEVFVLIGARIDGPAITKATTAYQGIKKSADEAQVSIERAAAAQNASMAEYASAAKRGEAASDRLAAANERWKSAAVLGGKVAAVSVLGVASALTGAAIAAASFDASMRNVNSIAGLSEKGFKSLEGQVLKLSTAVGKSPTDLANGLYSIVSSGFKAQDAMKILTAGARAARAGLTDTATATGALTAVLNSYGIGANGARKTSDLLFQAVNFGVENFTQLAGAMGKVLPQGRALGVSLQDLLAAQAALTRQGNSASESSTQLGAIFTALVKPSKSLSAELKTMGFDSGQAAIAHLGLKGTLDALGKAVGGNQATLASWFKNIRALRGVDGLEGTTHAATIFTAAVKSMDDATKGSGETAKVYAEQQKSTAAQFDHLKAAVDVAAVTIGSALLPQINAGITALTKWFAAAQKSGELQQWAHEIASGVSEVVTAIHNLGPDAEQAFRVIADTVKAAIPFVEELYHVFQTIEPAIADVAEAASGLAKALGPAPILAAAAGFLVFKRAVLETQVGVGVFSKIMLAGSNAIALSGGGAVSAAGKIDAIGAKAVEASGGVKIFARGLVSTIGTPNLIAAGAAGIVLGIVAINHGMEDMTQAAHRAADALRDVFTARENLQGAGNDLAQAKLDQAKAKAALPSAAAAVASAKAAAVATAGHPDISDPAVTAKINDQKQAILNYRDATLNVTNAQTAQMTAQDKLAASADALRKRLQGVVSKGLTSNAALSAGQFKPSAAIAGSFGQDTTLGPQRTPLSAPVIDYSKAAQNARENFDKIIAADNDLTASQKKTGLAVGALFDTIGRPPKPAELKIIADDVAAGRSVKEIKADLGWIGDAKPKAHVDADVTAAKSKVGGVHTDLANLTASPWNIKVGIPAAPTVQGALDHINQTILHLTSTPFKINVSSSVSAPKGGHFNSKGQFVYAQGGKVDGAQVAMIGEDGPEYVVPVGQKHRAAGVELWMAAGKDLGIPGYAAGKRPGKTPPPVKRGLGYDPSALDAQMGAEKQRLDGARQYRDTLHGRLTSDQKHHDVLEGELETAKKATSSKNKKTAASARARVSKLNGELSQLQKKMTDEGKVYVHQINAVIPADIKRYQAATAAAKVGDDHAKKISLWQDRADAATSAMDLASSQWDAANKKGDKAGMSKAYTAWLAAQKTRISDLGQAKTLIQEVARVVGKTDYGATIAKSLSTTLGDIIAAQDASQAPGYVDPTAAATPSTSIADYLYPEELAAQAQAALDLARAATTPDLNDDATAAGEELSVAQWIAGRLQQDGAPVDIITQALQAVASAQGDVSSAASAITNATQTANSVTADQQAQIDQATARATASDQNAASDRAALQAYQQSGDLFGGQRVTLVNNFNNLTPGSPDQQRQMTDQIVRGLGAQPAIPSTTGYYNG